MRSSKPSQPIAQVFAAAQPGFRLASVRAGFRFALPLSLCAIAGCSSWGSQQQSTTFAGGTQKRAELSCPRDRSERVDVGSWRGTGRPDVARVFVRGAETAKTVLACREVDLNGDGRKDMLVYYLPDGRKGREEFDHDYDGIPDVTSYYESGVLVRQELDVNFDGKPDLLQHFESGRLTRTERLWETKAEGEPGGAKADSKTENRSAAAPDAKPAPASGPGSAGATDPQEGGTAKNPPALLPSESTPRSITPNLPAPPPLPEPSTSGSPPR